MAKKKSASRTDAVREAVDQAFKSQFPRERISDLLDELGNTAGRLRGAVDELRPASEAEHKALRTEVRELTSAVQALTERVERLEAKPKPKPAARRATKPGAASRSRKPPATEPPASGS
ncbi:MAG: hypothetical protein QOD83_2822 [Solirubrobacteraceae bacterium]|jgi:hypothetical protein|nr:hypothetical protein [Solirubrobacteraceae bacterium]